MRNPEVFDWKKKFYYDICGLLSHNVKYSHLTGIVLARKY